MKIDCPHCGVHGSVDDSLAGKKLRCPKCSKVFLVTDDMVPEGGDNDLVRQELLHDPPDEPVADEAAELSDEESSTAAAEHALEEELDKIENDAGSEEERSDAVSDITDDDMFDPMPVQEVLEESDESTAEGEDESETPMDTCSACGESFASAFLVEVDSQLYCALCAPEDEDDEEGAADDVEDVDDSEEGEQEQESSIDDEEFLGFSGEEEEPEEVEDEDEEPEDSSENLELCEGCGESLHPQFLDSHEGKQYCALCFPGEEEPQEPEAIEEATAEEQEPEDSDEAEADAVDDTVSDDDLQEDEAVSVEEADDVEDVEDDKDDEAAIDAEETDQNVADEEQDEDGEFPQVPCAVCGETFHKDFLQEIDSKHYCGVCQPEVIETIPMEEAAGVTAAAVGQADGDTETAQDVQSQGADFTIGDLMREAWQKTKGVKGAIWGGTLVMYLIVFGVSFGGVFATQDMMRNDPGMATSVSMGLQLVTSWLSMLLGGGLMLIGVHRALEKRVRWKMIFAAFSKKKVISMTIASILQIVLICIGFLLLVLPGIYLSVGYALTLPLILDKGLGPWEALETSRKAIHTRWWSVLGAYFVMALLYLVSAIPFGLGVIWTMPMFMVLIGVIYARFFGPSTEQTEEGESVEEEDEDTESEEGEGVEEIAEESEAHA